MSQNSFFSKFDYLNSKGKPKAELDRNQYIQRFSDWERWSKSGNSCPIFCKIDAKRHANVWAKFSDIQDQSEVFRQHDGLFVRMDLLLEKEGFTYQTEALKSNSVTPSDFTRPVKEFFKEYILWNLSDELQESMSGDLIKHFHQGGVCTVANCALNDFLGGQPIKFHEAKQKISFEATIDGFKCSEQNNYPKIINTSNREIKISDSSFLITQVDLSVKAFQQGNGIQIEKISVSNTSEVDYLFQENTIQVLISKIVQWCKDLFGIKSTDRQLNEQSNEHLDPSLKAPILFSQMEQTNLSTNAGITSVAADQEPEVPSPGLRP